MAFTVCTANRLEWQYALPAKKDRTLIYKILQTYIITMLFIAGLYVVIGILLHTTAKQILFGFALIGGFFTAVMIICYPLTILLIKLILLYLKLFSRIVNGGKKSETRNDTDGEKRSAPNILYRFVAEEDKIHSWAVVETKGGKHVRYRSVRKMTRCKAEHWIEISGLMNRTTIYAQDEDFETVWIFLLSRCTEARIITEES